MADQGNLAGSRQILAANAGILRGMGGVRAMNLAAVGDGLARENLANAQAYKLGGSSEMRGMSKGLARRRRVATSDKGGVDMNALYGSNAAQDNMVQAFTGTPDAKVGKPEDSQAAVDLIAKMVTPEPDTTGDSGPDVSKSRSGRW